MTRIKQYSLHGVAGLVSQIRDPHTRRTFSVYVAEQAGFDSDPREPWLAVCEEHGTMVSSPTRALARVSLDSPEHWCESCRASGSMRRNPFSLTAPEPKPLVRSPSISGLTTFGILVNPRLMLPVLAVTDGEGVSIRSLLAEDTLRKIGSGYHSDRREQCSTFTDLPRVHTPRGVNPEGAGYGTALYSALCLGAHLTYEEEVAIKMKVRGDGVCSDTRDRSNDADAWWSAANKRGLTETTIEEMDEREEGVDITSDIDAQDLERIAPRDEGTIRYVNTVNVDIEKSESHEYDLFTYESLTEHSLVVASFRIELERREDLRSLWNGVLHEPDMIIETWKTPLLALDVRGLSEDAINLLSLLYMSVDLDDKSVDDMRNRWQRNLDPGAANAQQSLFRANAAGVADVMEARHESGWIDLRSLP